MLWVYLSLLALAAIAAAHYVQYRKNSALLAEINAEREEHGWPLWDEIPYRHSNRKHDFATWWSMSLGFAIVVMLLFGNMIGAEFRETKRVTTSVVYLKNLNDSQEFNANAFLIAAWADDDLKYRGYGEAPNGDINYFEYEDYQLTMREIKDDSRARIEEHEDVTTGSNFWSLFPNQKRGYQRIAFIPTGTIKQEYSLDTK